MAELSLENSLERISSENEGQEEYLQAVNEVAHSVQSLLKDNEDYAKQRIFERLAHPDRVIQFKITWMDDAGNIHLNRGWRVQQSNALGPYKGGLRFHPSANLSTFKFLAFEQIFKNALTGLPLGGAKGGSDFNPKGKSDNEIMRFCQAFMTELQHHVGPMTDVPAGDINVGSREIGYMYGQYKKIQNQFDGVLTGKELSLGGSYVREEATGFGVIYFLRHLLNDSDESIKDKTIAISGAGNVALHTAQKAIELGAKVTTLSNSRGSLLIEKGLSRDGLNKIKEYKRNADNPLKQAAEAIEATWRDDEKPWQQQKIDIAIPCATQNEVSKEDAEDIIAAGCKILIEGANMPLTTEALELLREELTYIPGKASNAGGVALSGLEMSQNSSFKPLSFDKLDSMLDQIMEDIYSACKKHGKRDDKIDYLDGANIAGFLKLAKATMALGV